MPEQIIYMRGGFLQGQLPDFAGAEFTGDARALLGLDPGLVAGLASALNTRTGFLDDAAATSLVRVHLASAEQAGKIARFVLGLERALEKMGLAAEELLKRLPDLVRHQMTRPEAVRQNEPSYSPLTPDEVSELTRRVLLLLGSKSALARQRKAERLLKVTGQQLEEIQLICDLRPIFDDDRAAVDGMFPITTLRVVATADNGMPIALEARMSFRQLEDLKKKVALAFVKLNALRELQVNQGIFQPILEREPEGDRG